MTLNSFLLILGRQIQQKWGRFLLASGGIMVGIWAITLTSSLSLGLSDTIVTAINSQPSAKLFSLYRTDPPVRTFFELDGAPKLIALGTDKVQEIKNKNKSIVDIVPTSLLNTYLIQDSEIQSNSNFSCVSLQQSIQNSINLQQPTTLIDPSLNISVETPATQETPSNTENNLTLEQLNQRCPNITFNASSFTNFYENNRRKWIGSTTEPAQGEIVTCFKCGNLEFNELLKVNNPDELIGKEITLEFNSIYTPYKSGEVVDVLNSQSGTITLEESYKKKVKVVAVIDDREDNAFGGSLNVFLNNSYFREAEGYAVKDLKPEEVGFTEYQVVIDSYSNLDTVIKSLQDDGYIAFSALQLIISGIETAFLVLTIVLAAFGFIALIASIFGIVNVMTISVLERKKEIGVLKSLGAKDSDIFSLFVIESAMLGFIGWLLGIGLAVSMGLLTTYSFEQFVFSNADWKANLDALNITSFSPTFPWWLLLGTLILALLFTVLSGVYPAIKAARQNPVEVLRSE